MAVIIQNNIVCLDKVDGHSSGKCVGQNLVFPDNENVRCMGRAGHMVIEHFLKCHQIIGQNFIGGIERNCLGQIFRLGRHRFKQASAVTMGNQQRDEQSTPDNQA